MIENCGHIDVALSAGARVPVRRHATDAGADLYAPFAFTVPARGRAVVDTGVHVQLPPMTKCEVKSRSGLWLEHGIITTGLVDEGYSGAVKVGLANLTDAPYHFHAGDRIAQLVISPVLYPAFRVVDSIEGGERGGNGFGSTGR